MDFVDTNQFFTFVIYFWSLIPISRSSSQNRVSAKMADGRVRLFKLSFCQLSAGMADGSVSLCKLSFFQAQLIAGMAELFYVYYPFAKLSLA